MRNKILKMMGMLLVLSLMLMAMPTPVAAQPSLSISVNPPDESDIFCDDAPTVTATVSNASGADCAEDVVITAVVTSGDATLTPLAPPFGLLYDICPESSKSATWTLNCDGPGPVTVQFTATPTNGDPEVLTVTYNQVCKLEVHITKPDDGDSFNISDTFAVTATVTNNTSEECTAYVALIITGSASIEGGELEYDVDIPPGDTQEVNWTVHCDGYDDVDLTVRATGCNQSGECADDCADTITIHQPPTPPPPCTCDLTVEILPHTVPAPEDDDVCVCDNWIVPIKVTNTGTCDLSYVSLYANVTAGAATFTSNGLSYRGYEYIGAIGAGQSTTVYWELHCDDAPLDLGPDCLGHNYVSLRARAYTSCPSCIPVCDFYSGWDTADDYIDQQYLELEITPKTCTNYCVEDEFWVEFTLRNCHEDYWDGDVSINVTGPGHVVGTPAVYDIHLEGNDGAPGGLDEWFQDHAWHIRCDGPGDVTINVDAVGIVELELLTLCDYETEVVHQKTPADIGVTVDAPECAQYCDEFDVTATISYTGGVNGADATDIYVTMTDYGHVEKISEPPSLGPFTLAYGDSPVVLTWRYHCDGWQDATFVVNASGTDEVCGGPVSDSDSDGTEQVKLDVEIIAPLACDTYEVCDTFCVTAEITDNDGDTSFGGLNAVISFPNGKADIVTDEVDTKGFTLNYGDSQQISWMVHCEEPGDTDIQVLVTGWGDACELIDKKDTITVHQVETELGIEIISPDTGAMYATSEEFAVTAVITNNSESGTVTITDVNVVADGAEEVAGPVPGTPFDIEPGKSKTVTWTLHCVESGPMLIGATVDGVGESEREVEAYSNCVLVWQYPAANLVVEISGEPEEPVVACTDFEITARIWNTGEADATEVYATLSVAPEDSVRVSEDDEEGTYTKYVGTIPGHGSEANYQDVTWKLHCKVACDSEIVVTASGNDEYGWHIKQECQTSGTFVIYEGYEYFETLWTYELPDPPGEYGAWTYGYFEGDANGLLGPFNFDADLQFAALGGGPDFFGHITGIGVVIPNASLDGDDLLGWIAHITMDLDFVGIYKDIWEFDVCGGLLQVINGNLNGAYLKGYVDIDEECYPEWEVGLLNGTYCSTMASTPGLAIPEKFIEPDGFTVKQITPAQLVVDISYPEDGAQFTESDDFVVTATVTNIGEETADGVHAILTVNENATITDADKDLDTIDGGEEVVVTWDVHCDTAGFSVMTVTASGIGELSDNTVEALDTVTVKQGEVPDAQLVVDISYPENGDEFIEGDEFPVTATVTNIGETDAENVNVSITISDNASVDSGPSGSWPQDIDAGDAVVVSWTLNCDSAGFSVIEVGAAGTNSNSAVDPVTIKQVPPPAPYLTVEVSAPAQIYEGEDFTVTAVVSNIGDAEATTVNVGMTASGPATPSSDSKGIPEIDAGESIVVEFELTCEGEGGVNVYVEVYGDDTNIAADSTAVQQIMVPEPAPYLTVEVSAPAQIYEGEDFTVTAVVSNIGDADASGVGAYTTVSGPAEPSSELKNIGILAAGDSNTIDFELTCTGEGGVNVAVTAGGPGANIAVDSAAVQQINVPEGEPALTVEVSAPAQIYVGEDFTVTAVVSNIGDAEAIMVEVYMTASGLVTPTSDSRGIPEFDAGDSTVMEFELTCEGEGGVNVYVEASGMGTNTAADSAAVQQKPPIPPTLVSIPDAAASVGGSIDVPIRITNVIQLGSADIWLSYDNSVVEVSDVTDGDLGTVTFGIDNPAGVTKMNWFSDTGKTGDFVFAYVTLTAVGSLGQTSDLDLTVQSLVDIYDEPILHGVDDGVFTIIGLMEGDVSLNGHVTISDAMFIAQHLVDIITLSADQFECADTTDEDPAEVTISDAMHIAQWLVDPDGTLGKLFEPLWESPADDHMLPPVP